MSWVEWLCLLGVASYVVRGSFFVLGAWREWRRDRAAKGVAPEGELPSVSVIIPARNEEQTIARCVESVMASDYPRFEVIVVDDRSTDRTAEVLQELQQRYGERLRVIHRREEPRERNLQGKAGALHCGMEQARGEVAAFTDADCIVPPTWLRAVVAPFRHPEVGFVAGLTVVSGRRLFDRIQAAEWLLLGAAGGAGVGWRQALGCYGNNMAVRCRAYWDVGGYARIPFSVTEDLSLQQAIHRRGWRMRFLFGPEGMVSTLPVATVWDRLRQLQRWGRGGLLLGGWAVGFGMTTVLFWGAVFAALLAGEWLWTLGLVGCRLVADGALGVLATWTLRRWQLLWALPLGILTLAVVELVLPFLVFLQPRVRWKGRTLS
ncbi:MAG: glycosyltransferase [Chlorobiota bacterium]